MQTGKKRSILKRIVDFLLYLIWGDPSEDDDYQDINITNERRHPFERLSNWGRRRYYW